MKRTTFLVTISILALSALARTEARAAGGTATGTLMHFNRQGNFCPSSRDCSGAKYPQSHWNTNRPIRHVKVYVRDEAGTILGQGSTSSSGSFTVSWFSPSLPPLIHITWHAEHKDDRFVVQSASGARWYFWTGRRTPVDGGITSFGTLTWGAPGAPHDITNIYDGAHRMWWDSLWWSNRQQSRFSGIPIYAGSTRCPTSCADATGVWLDPNAAYRPQARVMHEMGHTASQIAHENETYWPMLEYCYPSTGGVCGWNFDSPEWRQSGTEEGAATFLGDVALYAASARRPHTCISASETACPTNLFDTERSSGPRSTCAVDEDRWPLTLARVYWDLFDTQADCAGGICDGVSASIDQITDTFTAFPNGRGNGAKNEGWGCFIFEEPPFCWVDDPDARNIVDYTNHFLTTTGVSGAAVRAMNCN